MGGMLTFKASEVRRLVDHARNAIEHRPTFEELYDPALHKDGVVKMHEGGYPDQDNVDLAKVPPALLLVADQGVYLMSNGLPGLIDASGDSPSNVVAYAEEADPRSSSDDWYDSKVSIMGGDDGVDALPVEGFAQVLRGTAVDGVVCIRVTADHLEILGPSVEAQT